VRRRGEWVCLSVGEKRLSLVYFLLWHEMSLVIFKSLLPVLTPPAAVTQTPRAGKNPLHTMEPIFCSRQCLLLKIFVTEFYLQTLLQRAMFRGVNILFEKCRGQCYVLYFVNFCQFATKVAILKLM
jgi:hypothetical protein